MQTDMHFACISSAYVCVPLFHGTLFKKHKCKNEILENVMMAIAEVFEGKALHRLYA